MSFTKSSEKFCPIDTSLYVSPNNLIIKDFGHLYKENRRILLDFMPAETENSDFAYNPCRKFCLCEGAKYDKISDRYMVVRIDQGGSPWMH